ncbi:MAG: hypothetical protein BGO02_03790 [Brevundimonas sp. 67-6]|nr:MAG: hypothetical protein BGO02_03790 [Brevundimonas sp. 67-6]
MIFRVVDDATGQIVMSIDQPDWQTASLYLRPGQSLREGGDHLMIDDTRLMVVDGRIVRLAAIDTPGPLPGEGDELAPVAYSIEETDNDPDPD